jgi:aromatic ring hydroxylase-like protein
LIARRAPARSSALLVRPDGVVDWANEAAPDHDEAAQAASRWFGVPEAACESA